MKQIIFSLLIITSSINIVFGQTTTLSSQNIMIKTNHNYGLTNPLFDEASPMTYDANISIINAKGAAFSIDYTNQDGGTNFDGYPSGTIGGFKTGGTYYPADFAACGMPVQLQNLANDLRIKWKPVQSNVGDIDDKWWATINVIFDDGLANDEPVSTDRDYDLVIQFQRYEQDALLDKANNGTGSYYWFARDAQNDVVPFSLMIEGVEYQWAVRYKFFSYPVGHANEHKNNKVHIKFIPIDNNNIPIELDHPLKTFVDATVSYLQYVNLPTQEANLAAQKVAASSLWVKSISAGYEVYSGNSTLGQEHFYTVVDNTVPNAPLNLSAQTQGNTIRLDWDTNNADSYEAYKIYRSENGGAFTLLTSTVYTNTYVDNSVTNGMNYQYYITVLDRSFNESSPSSTVTITSSLPVELLHFSATLEDKTVKLSWQTSTEINNAYFTVERSQNGIDWSELTRVDGAGNSTALLNYSTTDFLPYYGKSYYRLKQTDFDEQNSYSDVATVNILKERKEKVEIYPNPTRNQITVIATASELENVKVYNVLGQDVTNSTVITRENIARMIVDLSSLNSGIYYLMTTNSVNKVLKQ